MTLTTEPHCPLCGHVTDQSILVSVSPPVAVINGRVIELSRDQATVLSALNGQFGRLVTKDALYQALFGQGDRADDTLRWHIWDLRKIINPLGYAIITMHSRGFVLCPREVVADITSHGKRNMDANAA